VKKRIRQIVDYKNKPPLRIINIGGTTDVNANLTLYECGDEMIAVDCGIGFPDSDMPGVDVVIPDFTYLLDNKEKLKGIFITHAHEDHFGAVPYLLKELNVPVYSNDLVHGFVKSRLEDRVSKQLAESASLIPINPDLPEVNVGCFKVSAFGMNHSVPNTMGFAINTPQGLILHISDFKVDWTPVLDKPLELGKIAKYGDSGVLCLLSDCLGVTHTGNSRSESTLSATFDRLFEKAEGRQILVTTISSNISRMHQIITSAIKTGRKVSLVGRSIRQSVEIAQSLGYLNFDPNVFVRDKKSKNLAQKDLVYIVAGCYGQSNSALAKISRDENRYVSLEENSLVVFSADPNPPGTREDVEKLMDELTLKDAEVIYSEIQDNLHVSGHGMRGDIMTIAAAAKPKYFIPVGGTVTKMRAYKNMVEDLGFGGERVFEQLEGESVVFEKGIAKKGKRVEVKKVLVEGKDGGEVRPIVVKDRGVLASDGVLIVLVPINSKGVVGKIDVISRGFVYVKESGDLVGSIKNKVHNVLEKNSNKLNDWGLIKNLIERDIHKYIRKQTGRNPMIIAHNIKV